MITAILQRLKSRTYQVALVLSVLTILEANLHVLIPLFPAALQPYIPLVFALAMMVMREITKVPVQDK